MKYEIGFENACGIKHIRFADSAKERDEIIKEIRNYGETTHYWFYPVFQGNKCGNTKHFYKDN